MGTQCLKVKEQKPNLTPDQLNEVVDKVQTRWLGAIDKFEPEIDREFLDKMKEDVNEVHKT